MPKRGHIYEGKIILHGSKTGIIGEQVVTTGQRWKETDTAEINSDGAFVLVGSGRQKEFALIIRFAGRISIFDTTVLSAVRKNVAGRYTGGTRDCVVTINEAAAKGLIAIREGPWRKTAKAERSGAAEGAEEKEKIEKNEKAEQIEKAEQAKKANKQRKLSRRRGQN